MKTALPLLKWLSVTLLIAVLLAVTACSSGTTSATPTTTTPVTTTPATSTPATTTPIKTTPPITTPTATATPTTSPSQTTTPAPSITITEPTSNKFSLGSVTVTVDVKNFNLTNKLGQPKAAGEGHIHYFMDVDPAATPGQPAVTAPGTYSATADTSYTWNNVGGGQHKFSVELVNNDHTPLNPPVIASQSILVVPEIGPPSAVILTPRDNGIVDGNSVTVTVQVANFNLVDKLGQANSPREGHLHYFLDVDAPTTAGKPAVTAPGTYAATAETTYTWQNVAPGNHTLSIELINNDHTPLDTPVVAKVTIKVNSTNPATTTTSSPSSTPTSSGQSVTIDLVAQSMAFDKSTISVPAGADVTVNFNNKDGGIPHNFSVYQTLAGGQVKQVFIGQVITGPSNITYHFKAPTDIGDYFFVCDVHPQLMTGKFVITQ